jgi:hypothetical protein
MNVRRVVVSSLVLAVLLPGCSARSSEEGAGTGRPDLSASAVPSDSGGPTAEPVTLRVGERALEAGTYRFDLWQPGGGAYPAFVATFPDGWTSMDSWAVSRDGTPSSPDPNVAVTFWDVDEIYGHPCQWQGTLVQPGTGVDELVAALVAVPMRNATSPSAVELGGYAGMYLEWSVPADLKFDEQGNFPDCDGDGAGHYDFRSWTGVGGGSTRYHQGPGQVDRLWILDVDGKRLVIDAFSMPEATGEEIAQINEIVDSIRFADK